MQVYDKDWAAEENVTIYAYGEIIAHIAPYELGIGNPIGNLAYTPTTLVNEEILNDHKSLSYSFGF